MARSRPNEYPPLTAQGQERGHVITCALRFLISQTNQQLSAQYGRDRNRHPYSPSRAFDNAEANSPVGTATIPSPTISTKKVNTLPPTVTGVTVAHGRQGDDGPPEGMEDRSERLGLRLILEVLVHSSDRIEGHWHTSNFRFRRSPSKK